jgi:hypothetical protein
VKSSPGLYILLIAALLAALILSGFFSTMKGDYQQIQQLISGK